MVKVKINKDVEVPVVDAPVAEVVEKKVEAKWPEVGQTGRFNAVEWQGGWVVYNPAGQRATGVLKKEVADDIVRENNRAAQIKK